jgi:hypothetical protein
MEGNAFVGAKGEPPTDPSQAAGGVESPSASPSWDSSEPVIDEPLVSYDESTAQESSTHPEEAQSDFVSVDFNSDESRSGLQSEPHSQAAPSETVSKRNTPSSDLGPADDPLGLARFAKSEISQANDGTLVFRVLISGIDTKELRDSLREVLEDSRFVWDPGAILAKLSKGTLTIENLSPVKAMILVNQIKRLPVKIRWEQNAISQIDP